MLATTLAALVLSHTGCARDQADESGDAGASTDTDADTLGTTDDVGAGCDLTNLEVSFDQVVVAFDYWTGDPIMSKAVALTLSDPDCELSVAASPDWLATAIGAPTSDGVEVVLTLPGTALSTGTQTGVVEIVDTEGTPRASIPVQARALLAGSANAHRRVMVIGVDGLRPDAVEQLDLPTLDALMDRGRSTFVASTQLTTATKSGPGWASILTGVEASKHLVDSNDDLAEIDRDYPTMLARLAALGFDVSSVGNWPGIASLIEDEVDATSYFGQDATVAQEAMVRIDGGKDMIFLQFDSVDISGHVYGFDPAIPQYADAVRNVDEYAGQILARIVESAAATDEDWLIVLVTDHAGQDKDHGPQEPIYQTIPLSLASPAHERGSLDDVGASHMDVAPTVFEYLGVPIDPLWELDGASRW